MRYMTPYRTRTFTPTDFFADFGSLFKDFSSEASPEVATGWFAPALDLEEQEQKYVVSVDLPGMKKEDIKIDIHDGVLALTGERTLERKEKGHYERTFGSFTRKVTLPTSVDEEAVEAKYENGVLKIHIPKAEKEKKKVIPIS